MIVHPSSRSVLLKAPDPFALRELLPKSLMLNRDDFNIAVRHTLESTQLLRNIGFDVPAPIASQYTWPGKYKAMSHQIAMASFMTMHPRCFNLSDPGTCKTAAALWAADYLMSEGYVQRVLVLSPLSTMERTWQQDIFDVLMHRTSVQVYGSRERRLEALKVQADFYILNHDGVKIKDVARAIKARPDIDLVIWDESSVLRNAQTEMYKALVAMLRPNQRLWLMSGTPCPNAPTDAWAQARLVNPAGVPMFFGSFRRATMEQASQFKWVPRKGSSEMAYQALQPAIRFKKSECLDLPPVIYLDRKAQLTPEQNQAFKRMRDIMQTDAATNKITAVNAADKVNKLRQILCGSILDPTTETYMTIPHHGRTEVVLEAIEEASAKVIVIVPFKGIIQALEREIGKKYSVGVLNGDVSIRQRNQIIRDFKETAHPHVLLCHPKVMSHGLNLTEADLLIFYAPIYSNDEFQQVTERFNRPGQTRKMTIIRVAAHPLEWEIYRLVDSKKVTQDDILNLYTIATQ